MKNILPLLSILLLISCKKELNTDLSFEGEKYFKNTGEKTMDIAITPNRPDI